jgi:hypothetical protein
MFSMLSYAAFIEEHKFVGIDLESDSLLLLESQD